LSGFGLSDDPPGAAAIIATLLYFGRQAVQADQIAEAASARELQQKHGNLCELITSDSEVAQRDLRDRPEAALDPTSSVG